MKRFATMTAVALLISAPAFAQDRTEATLNQEVYATGMAQLQDDGYNVETVRQDRSGNLTFMARNETNGRILVMDDNGDIMSDTMADLSTGVALNAEGTSDDSDRAASLDLGTDLGVSAQSDSNGRDSSGALNVNTGLNLGASAMGNDGNDSGSIGIDTGVDVGVSAQGSDGDNGGSLGVSIGGGLGLGVQSGS